MPSGSISSEATSSRASGASRDLGANGPARGLDELAQRRHVESCSRKELADVREIVRGIDGQADVGPAQRRGRGHLDDAEQLRVATHVRRDVLAIVGVSPRVRLATSASRVTASTAAPYGSPCSQT